MADCRVILAQLGVESGYARVPRAVEPEICPRANTLNEPRIEAEDEPAFTDSERFRRMEAHDGRRVGRPHGIESRRCIDDNRQAASRAEPVPSFELDRTPERHDGHDGANLAWRSFDDGRHRLRVERPCLGIHVDEEGHEAGCGRRLSGGDEGPRGHDAERPRSGSLGGQRQRQAQRGIHNRRDRALGDAEMRGETRFELGSQRAEVAVNPRLVDPGEIREEVLRRGKLRTHDGEAAHSVLEPAPD